VQQQQQQQGV